MTPSRCTPPPQELSKETRMQSKASQFSGSHRYKTKENQQTTL